MKAHYCPDPANNKTVISGPSTQDSAHGRYKNHKLAGDETAGSHFSMLNRGKPSPPGHTIHPKRKCTPCHSDHHTRQKAEQAPSTTGQSSSSQEGPCHIPISTVEKKSPHSTGSHTIIKDCSNLDSPEIKLINSFTEEQIIRYFGHDFKLAGWPAIKPGHKKSILLDRGDYSKVKLAELTRNNHSELVAVKKISSWGKATPQKSEQLQKNCLSEARLQRLAEPIAPAIYTIAGRLDEKHNNYKTYIVMELVKSATLETIMDSLNQHKKLSIACLLAEKVLLLHQKMIYFGDLKTTNILVNPHKEQIHIIDFGCAQSLENTIKIDFDPADMSHYHAPEVYRAALNNYHHILDKWKSDTDLNNSSDTSYNQLILPRKSDIYSLGIILAAMFSNKAPECWYMAYKKQDLESFDELTRRKFTVGKTENDLQPLITQMLKADPSQRPNLPEVISELRKLWQQKSGQQLQTTASDY